MSADVLRRAAAKLRQHAAAAVADPDERWMVDQSANDGLVLASYMPGDVDDDGTVHTSCIAYFAYPGDEDQRSHGTAFGVASYAALMQPTVALALAAAMDEVAKAVRFGTDMEARLGYGELIVVAREVLREMEGTR